MPGTGRPVNDLGRSQSASEKNKTASIPLLSGQSSPTPSLPFIFFCIYRVFFFWLSCVPRLPSPPSSCLPFCTIMRASHVEKRDYLRHGIENAARASLSDARLPRFWSGFLVRLLYRGNHSIDQRESHFVDVRRAAIGMEPVKQ